MPREETTRPTPRPESGSRVTVRIGRSVPTFQTDLMAAEIAEFKKEFRVNLHAALRFGVELYHPASNSLRIELRVPWSIKRVREIDAPSVAAHFHHLRAAVQRHEIGRA